MPRVTTLLTLITCLFGEIYSQHENKQKTKIDDDIVSIYIDLNDKYMVLNCLDGNASTNKALLLSYQLYNDKYSHTNFFEEFVDSLRWIIQNNWVIEDVELDLNQYYISKSHYIDLIEHESIDIYERFFNSRGSWNNVSTLQEMKAAVTILIERGFSVYFTSFSRFHMSVPPTK